MLLNLFVLQRNCKKETLSHRIIHRFSSNLSSINNTKHKVIPSYLNKFINHLMVDGKKGIAVEIFADSLRLFSRKLQEATPLLIKNQHESALKTQAFLLDGRYRAPAFALKPIWCSSLPITIHHSPSLPLLGNLAKPSKEAKHMLITTHHYQCSSLMSNSKMGTRWVQDEQFQDRHKMGNEGVRLGVQERTVLPGKQHHFRKTNSPSPSLINCLEQALINVEPSLEVRKKKIAGITRQIPSTLSKSRGQGLAIRWIVESARGRRQKEGKRFSECLAEELVSAYHKKGEPRQKRDALHKLAESNRSFLRYRWW